MRNGGESRAAATPPVTLMLTDMVRVLRHHRRALLVYYLFFTGLAVAVLVPITTWPMTAVRFLSGEAALSLGDLVAFVMSPGGWLWLFVATVAAVFLAMLHQAGMLFIAAGESGREYRLAVTALWRLGPLLPRMLLLALVRVAAHLLLALPFVLLLVATYQFWLAGYDVYTLRTQKPPELWWFAAVAVPLLVGMALVQTWLYVRWLLALPVFVFERLDVVAALAKSASLSRGKRRPVALFALSGLLALVLLPALVSVLFTSVGGPLMAWLPTHMSLLAPAVLLFVALYFVFTVAAAFLVVAVNSVLLYALYHWVVGARPRLRRAERHQRFGRLAWGVEAAVIALAVLQAGAVMRSFNEPRDVNITAHRGSSLKAPENTLSAIRQALEDGADYIEIDVRQTADGRLVLWHDRDLQRIVGLDRPIWEVPLAVARGYDVGLWFAEDFSGERIATLAEAMAVVRGKAKLYIEIKPAPATPDLTANVVRLVQSEGFVYQTVIASGSREVLREVRRLEPALPTVLFAQFIVGPFRYTGFDALGLRANRVTPGKVAKAHANGQEMHVWTVNSRHAMNRFIDMGVDNIITDRPDMLADVLRERAALSEGERMIWRLRHWLSNVE